MKLFKIIKRYIKNKQIKLLQKRICGEYGYLSIDEMLMMGFIDLELYNSVLDIETSDDILFEEIQSNTKKTKNHIPNYSITGKNNENKHINKVDNLFDIKLASLEFDTTDPYLMLDIEKKHYTNNELLDIVKNRIIKIREFNLDKQQINNRIDFILDAYNYIKANNEPNNYDTRQKKLTLNS